MAEGGKAHEGEFDDLTIVDPPDYDDEPTLGPTPPPLEESDEMHLRGEGLIGRLLGGQYILERVIGVGGAGTVFQARDRESPMMFAVKVLHEELSAVPELAGRFRREAVAAQQLAHENVVRVLDFGQEDDGTLFLVMEYVPGRSLKEVIAAEGSQPFHRIVALTSQLCRGLAVAHARGILHRDVKPANVILVQGFDSSGDEIERVKICDFGLARLPPHLVREESAESMTGIGKPRGVLGTAHYMSPEQVRGDSLDARSDVYACGVTMYEMATGRVPFDAPNPISTMLQHVNDQPTPPRKIAPSVDRALELLILRCLKKDPAERPTSADELRAALLALRA
jgi:serine/threonine-protein kinase